mgnify:CR=1 FL=1
MGFCVFHLLFTFAVMPTADVSRAAWRARAVAQIVAIRDMLARDVV